MQENVHFEITEVFYLVGNSLGIKCAAPTRFKPWTSRLPCWHSTNWAIKAAWYEKHYIPTRVQREIIICYNCKVQPNNLANTLPMWAQRMINLPGHVPNVVPLGKNAQPWPGFEPGTTLPMLYQFSYLDRLILELFILACLWWKSLFYYLCYYYFLIHLQVCF